VRRPLPDEVGIDVDDLTDDWENHRAILCHVCFDAVSKGEVPPNYCLAKGYDYGEVSRLPGYNKNESRSAYPPLTTGEAILLSDARPYFIVVKMTSTANTRTLKLASHIITMPFAGGSTLAKELPKQQLKLPHDPSYLRNVMKVTWTGTEKFNKVRSGLLEGLKHALIRPQIMLNYLRLMQAVSVRFQSKNCQIPRSVEDMDVEGYKALGKLPDQMNRPNMTKDEKDS
jgi:hypothetical protein